LEIMERHANQPLMMTDAVFFLKNFSFGEVGRSVIMQNNGITIVLNAIGDHIEHMELMELSINVLFDLSFSGGVEVLMLSPHGVQLIVKVMETYPTDVSILGEALRAITRIYDVADEEQKKLIIKARIVPALLKILRNNPTRFALVKLVHDTFTLLAQEPVKHERLPESAVPSFTELCARSIIDSRISIREGYLPRELESNLHNECKSCSLCGKSYFGHWHEVISFVKYPEFEAPLPTFWKVCSRQCFVTASNKT